MKYTVVRSLVLLLIAACDEPGKPTAHADRESASTTAPVAHADSKAPPSGVTSAPVSATQISQYIRRMFQDRDGNMWFGTTSDGVARYDGRDLVYFNAANGLGSDWVSSMVQDQQGNLWFGTRDGVSRFDGNGFTRYTTKDGLADDRVWCLLLDKSGVLWCGTQEGVSRFNGRTFTSFPIPAADLSQHPYYQDPKQINWIIQDKAGNIWFASNGGGAYRYDGHTLTNLSEKDGLCNNFVQTILEDRAGNLWLGTRYGGLCKYDPGSSPGAGSNAFTQFTRKELKGDHVWTVYQDSAGMIWISVAASGLCSYDGTTFTCYNEQDGEGIRVVQSLLEDASGQLWIGTSNGVYKFDPSTPLRTGRKRFTNWTKQNIARRAAEEGGSVFKAVPRERN
ncbi:MAG: two-component regulator propeller domain-containing protein [Flavobacteriales bacterium]